MGMSKDEGRHVERRVSFSSYLFKRLNTGKPSHYQDPEDVKTANAMAVSCPYDSEQLQIGDSGLTQSDVLQ